MPLQRANASALSREKYKQDNKGRKIQQLATRELWPDLTHNPIEDILWGVF